MFLLIQNTITSNAGREPKQGEMPSDRYLKVILKACIRTGCWSFGTQPKLLKINQRAEVLL